MTSLALTHYDTPHLDETVGHASRWSMWRYFSGFATSRTVIITSGVATPSPGAVNPTVDQIAGADASTSDTYYEGKAVWASSGTPWTVTSAEATILTTAGYTLS